MPLHRKNTWSEQTLEVERHLAGARETGFLTADKRAMLLLAAKTALAAGLLLLAGNPGSSRGRLLGLDQRHHRAAVERRLNRNRLNATACSER